MVAHLEGTPWAHREASEAAKKPHSPTFSTPGVSRGQGLRVCLAAAAVQRGGTLRAEYWPES